MISYIFFFSLVILIQSELVVGPSYKYGAKIFELGEEILLQKCQEVSIDDILNNKDISNIRIQAHRVLDEFRRMNGFGRAIAAPQLGFGIQYIALNLKGQKFNIYNPMIINYSKETFEMWDDCLSFPDSLARVERYVSISIQFIDEKGVFHKWEDCDMELSELLQHEIDHLNGTLAIDRAVLLANKKSLPKVESIVNRSEWEENKEYFESLLDNRFKNE